MAELTTDVTEVIKKKVAERNPSNPLEHALLFAELKAKEGITQKQYGEVIETSARTLRDWIAKHRVEYETALREFEKEIKELNNPQSMGRLLTESQLDTFVESLINAAIAPKATVRDRQLLIDLLGVDGKTLLELQESKKTSLRWFLKGNVATFKKFTDTKEMGIMIETSDLLTREDDKKEENVQRFVDMDITDESLKLEAMYFGLLFMSLYNSEQHPDMGLVATAVRLDRLKREAQQNTEGRHLFGHYAEGENYTKEQHDKRISSLSLLDIMRDILDKEEFAEYEREYVAAEATIKPPEIDKVKIRNRQTEHEDELKIFTTLEEQTRNLLGMDQK